MLDQGSKAQKRMPLHCITLDCWLEPEVEVAVEEAAGGSRQFWGSRGCMR